MSISEITDRVNTLGNAWEQFKQVNDARDNEIARDSMAGAGHDRLDPFGAFERGHLLSGQQLDPVRLVDGGASVRIAGRYGRCGRVACRAADGHGTVHARGVLSA